MELLARAVVQYGLYSMYLYMYIPGTVRSVEGDCNVFYSGVYSEMEREVPTLCRLHMSLLFRGSMGRV